MKHRLWLLILALFCCISFSASLQASDSPRPLKVVSPWKAKGMNLDKSGFIFARMGCIEMLTTAEKTGKVTGLLAKSWQVAKDGCTWTFTLRPGVTFHDGTALSGKAAAHTLNIALGKKGLLSKANVVEIAATGPMTLKIVTSKPFSALPAYLAHYSNGIISKASFDNNGHIKTIYGTGQYKLTGFQGDSLFRFSANSDYWGEAPGVALAEYYAVPKGETRGFMMKAGQADMAFTLSPMDAGQLTQQSDVTVETLSIPRARMIALNCSLPFFSDKQVRRAISLAIDRSGIAAALLRNPPSAATQLLPSTASMWHNPDLPHFSFDPEKAASLLKEAGWVPGSDGILVKGGERFSFTLTTYATRPMLPPVATAVQDQLKKVGIEMKIEMGESSLIPEKHKKGTLQGALMARNFGQIPDAVGTIYGDLGPVPGAWGPLGWQSTALNETLATYLATFDQDEAQALRNKVLGIIQDELPIIPITWYEHIVAYSNRLEGVDIDPFEIQSYLKGVHWKK